MELETQICTNIEQSKRLMALGLKAETADMRYQIKYFDWGGVLKECTPSLEPYPPLNNDRFIPAWSLHRLIKIMPYNFANNNNTYELQVTCDGAGYDDIEDLYPIVGWWHSNTYDDIIDCIKWLIKEGYFNKEYLEE